MEQNRRARLSGALLLCWLVSVPLTTAREQDPPRQSTTETQAQPELPAGFEIDFEGQYRRDEEGNFYFTGPTTVTSGESRIQADTMSFLGGRYIEAEGNVLVVWLGNRISGTRMTYDLQQESGLIEDAIGQVTGGYVFWASTAEKIGPDKIRLESATFTTCTQPTPYWSFKVTSATITMDKYARMWNVRLKAGPVPLVYLPYLVWPVKKDRALGLLMPEFHSNDERGNAISQKLFIPLGRSADLTLEGRYYTDAGLGGGGELRFVPNRRGSASLSGFYIQDKTVNPADPLREEDRFNVVYKQTQRFLNGFRMVADVNLVSDFQYYTDFERELNLVSSPTILARLEFSRNGAWTSMNVRELRREQFFSNQSELLQQTLPEIEWRGRSRRIGKSPLYFSYESSVASIQQREDPAPCTPPACSAQQLAPLDADYFRADLFPEVSLPLSPAPWIEITPTVRYRATHYTQSQGELDLGAPGTTDIAVNDSITRTLWQAGLEIVGPKFQRVFERPDSPYSAKYKHSIEPTFVYGYQESFDRGDEIILFDEVDRFSGSGELINYGIVQRLFAKRQSTRPVPPDRTSESVVLPDGTTAVARTDDDPAPEPMGGAPKPVEIATFELRQSRALDRSLSFADLDGDGINESESNTSGLQIVGRFNPGPTTSFDLRSNYDILYDDFSDFTVSGSVRKALARLRFSVVFRNGLGVDGGTLEPRENDTQLRLTTGFALLNGKLRLDVDGSYDHDPSPGQRHIPDKRWRVQYATQCCTFLVERLSRNFSSSDLDRQDFYFRVDLKGVGKLLDFKY